MSESAAFPINGSVKINVTKRDLSYTLLAFILNDLAIHDDACCDMRTVKEVDVVKSFDDWFEIHQNEYIGRLSSSSDKRMCFRDLVKEVFYANQEKFIEQAKLFNRTFTFLGDSFVSSDTKIAKLVDAMNLLRYDREIH